MNPLSSGSGVATGSDADELSPVPLFLPKRRFQATELSRITPKHSGSSGPYQICPPECSSPIISHQPSSSVSFLIPGSSGSSTLTASSWVRTDSERATPLADHKAPLPVRWPGSLGVVAVGVRTRGGIHMLIIDHQSSTAIIRIVLRACPQTLDREARLLPQPARPTVSTRPVVPTCTPRHDMLDTRLHASVS
jgi:hypothetical protein